MRRALLILLVLCPILRPASGIAREGLVIEEPSFVPGVALADEVRTALREALYRKVELLGDEVFIPRPAQEAHRLMRELSARLPREAAVMRYLSRAALSNGDVKGAEAAVRAEIELAPGEPQAYLDLADFFKGRGQGQREMAAVEKLIAVLRQKMGKMPALHQREALGRAYERAIEISIRHGLGSAQRFRRALVELYPDDPSRLRAYLDQLVRESLPEGGPPGRALSAREVTLLKEIARYRTLFPSLGRDLMRVEAGVYEAHRDTDAALRVYRSALEQDPLPQIARQGETEGIYEDLVDLLRRRARDREMIRSLASRARAGRLEGFELALLCQLYQRSGEEAKALALIRSAIRTQKGGLKARELLLRARLLLNLSTPLEAIPVFYAAYRAAEREPAPATQEDALVDLGHALLRDVRARSALTPLSPLWGFSLRHVRGGPSIAGGLASFLFGSHAGQNDAQAEDLAQAARALANATRVIRIYREMQALTRKAPAGRAGGGRGAGLLADVVELYRDYKEYAEAYRLADEFTAAYPDHPRYFDVALIGCEARMHRRAGDGPCMRRVLDEAARRGDRAAYDRVLSAFVDALTREKRRADVVRLFWEEIGRRGADAGIYDRFLGFLISHNMFADELRVYEQAVRAIPGGSFLSRMARFHVRTKGAAALRDFLRKVVAGLDADTASGLLADTVSLDFEDRHAAESMFFHEIYRQAMQRFPLDLRFSERLLAYCDRRDGRDGESPRLSSSPEAMRLLKQLALARPDHRLRLMQQLAQAGRLEKALAEVSRGRNEAERVLHASLLVFLSRQEEALPVLAELRRSYPHDRWLLMRHAALLRALAGPSRGAAAAQAAALLDEALRLHPTDEELMVQAGDYLAEGGMLDEALRRFARITQLAPADPQAHMRLAALQWDYYAFAQAADSILTARRQSADPLRFADRLAAVYESRRDYGRAIEEYVRLYAAELGLISRRFMRPDEERRDNDEAEGLSYSAEANGTATASGRLLYLARRRGQAAAIEKAFRAEHERDPNSQGVILAFMEHLLALEAHEKRRAFALAAIDRLTEIPVLRRIVEEAEERGRADEPVRLAALRRVVALTQGAPGAVYALETALREAGDMKAAEAELRALVDRLDRGGEDDAGESVDARLRLAQLLWDQRRRDEAITVRVQAAQKAALERGDRRDQELLHVARWQAQAGRPDAAERTARDALSRHPGDLAYVSAVADLLWQRGARDAALALYRQQLDAAGKQAGVEGRREMVRGLRQALIGRLREMGRTREAVDLWIEAAQAAPGDRAALEDLYEFARLSGLGPRVISHFERAARRSHKDPRWPEVLSVLLSLDGNMGAAAARLGEAIALSPQRIDLRERHAQALSDAGSAVEAAMAYHKLWLLSDKDPRYAALEVEQLGRAGRRAEALAMLGTYLGPDVEEPSRHGAAAELLQRVGLLQDAARHSAEAVRRAAGGQGRRPLEEQHAALYVDLHVRTGQGSGLIGHLRSHIRAAQARANAESEEERWKLDATVRALEGALSRALPESILKYGTSSDLSAFAAELRGSRISAIDAVEQGAAMAQRAGMGDVARDLYRTYMGRWPVLGAHLRQSLESAWLLREAAEETMRAGAGSRAADAAGLLRRLGDLSAEERLLTIYFRAPGLRLSEPGFAPYSEDVARLLDLLLGAGRRGEVALRELAASPTPFSAQTAGHLMRSGRIEPGLIAISALSPKQASGLTALRQGLALLEVGADSKRASALIGRTLVLSERGAGPIARLLSQQGRLFPDAPFRSESAGLAMVGRYGQALALAGRPAEATLAAWVEARPTTVEAYIAEGDAYAQAKRWPMAVSAYRLARSLAPRDASALDRLAQALWASGGRAERREALALWDEPLTQRGANLEKAHLRRFEQLTATAQPELVSIAAQTYGTYVLGQAARYRPAELVAALKRLAAVHKDRRMGAPFERLARDILSRLNGPDLLVLSALARGQGALLAEEAREPFLRQGIAAAKEAEKIEWYEELGRWGLRTKRLDAAIWAAQEAERVARERSLPVAQWMIEVRAQALWSKGQAAQALDLLRGHLGLSTAAESPIANPQRAERLAALVPFLREHGRQAELDELLVAVHKETGGHRQRIGDSVALIEALLRRGERAEALLMLARLSRSGAEGLRVAAETGERLRLNVEAVALWRRLAEIHRASAWSALGLARALSNTGTAGQKEAVSLLGPLVVGPAARAASREERAQAAELLARLERSVSDPTIADIISQSKEEPALLLRARTMGDLRLLREDLSRVPWPRHALMYLAGEALRRGEAEAALADALRLVSFAGLGPAVREIAVEAARQSGRHALAVSLELGDDPLRPRGPVVVRRRDANASVQASMGLAESAARAGFPAARQAFLSGAVRLLRESGRRAEADRIDAQRRLESARLSETRARVRRPVVTPDLRPDALAAPPEGPYPSGSGAGDASDGEEGMP